MTLTKHNACALVVDTITSTEDWCVFEHHVVLKEGEPPTIVLVGACKLPDVYRLVSGKTNSEWVKLFSNGGKVLVQVIATTEDKQEAFRLAAERVAAIEPTPVCNLRGHSLRSAARSIVCVNNGRRYNTQQDAASDLGIHASSISRHLNGQIAHAQGFTFTYGTGDA